MENVIDTIDAATANDTSAESRAAGAQACRTILAALEAKEAQSLAAPIAIPNIATPIQAIASALRTMPIDQILDLAIRRLQAALPAGTEIGGVHALQIPLVSIATGGQS